MKSLQRILSAIIYLSLITSSAFAHSGFLTGKVTDNLMQHPLAGVTISIEGSSFKTVTDSSGSFYFEKIPAGSCSIIFHKEGYLMKEFKVSIVETDTVTINLTLTSNVIDLPDLIIHGERPLSAASSSVLSKIDFELRPKNSAQDLLRLVPGLFIAQHAGGGKAEQIFVRGFDCDHGTDVATFVDGLPVNMPSHGHGQGYADLHFLIPELVNNMEVYKGPYWAQFGDFATGAAVRFKTVDHLENNSFTIEGSTVPMQRTFTGARSLIMLQLPVTNENISSYLAGDFIFNHGYFDIDQKFGRFTAFSKTTFNLSDHSSLMFSFNGFGSSWNASGQIPERAVSEGMIGRFGSIDTTEGGTTQRNNINLVYSSKQKGNEFMSQVYTGNYRFRLFSDFSFFLNDPVNGDEIEQDDYRTFLGYNGSYTISGTSGSISTKTTFGAGFRADNIENQLWHAASRVRLEPRAHSNIYERNMYGFVKQELQITPQLHIEAALRENYFTYDVEDLLPVDSPHKNISGMNYQFLMTPKFNVAYYPSNNVSLFLNSGLGYHSNDARSVVLDQGNHRLPRAAGAEAGTQLHITNSVIFSLALWMMDLSNELVYAGDDGTTEDKGASRRRGIDFGARIQLTRWLLADMDINYSKNNLLIKFLGSELPEQNLIPLAPTLTSTGGLTARFENGLETALRYRYIDDRPANESNSIIARGCTIVDLSADYHVSLYKIGLTIENFLNTEWNEAQFATETRLFNENSSVDELCFTPGTPFSARLSVTAFF